MTSLEDSPLWAGDTGWADSTLPGEEARGVRAVRICVPVLGGHCRRKLHESSGKGGLGSLRRWVWDGSAGSQSRHDGAITNHGVRRTSLLGRSVSPGGARGGPGGLLQGPNAGGVPEARWHLKTSCRAILPAPRTLRKPWFFVGPGCM